MVCVLIYLTVLPLLNFILFPHRIQNLFLPFLHPTLNHHIINHNLFLLSQKTVYFPSVVQCHIIEHKATEGIFTQDSNKDKGYVTEGEI